MNININNLFLFIQENKNSEVETFLQQNGIEVKDEFGRTALLNAAFYNNSKLIEWLLKNGADVNSQDNNGYSALHFAVQEAHYESAKSLIENNAKIDVQDNNGNTPVWVCIMHWKGGRNMNNLKLLYKNNANLEIKNNAGRSAKDIIPKKILDELNSFI